MSNATEKSKKPTCTTSPVPPVIAPPHKTRDLKHATIYIASGIRFIGVENNQTHTLFVFEDDPRINEVTAQFLNDELFVNARDLFRIWSDLRALTYTTPRPGR